MATKKSEERFSALRAAYLTANRAARDESIRQSIKYGGDQNARSWASRGDKTKLEKLNSKSNKVGDAIIALVVKESPRGEAWTSGVPITYLREKLAWEDVTRPANEPLSTLPPTAWGWSETDLRRHLGVPLYATSKPSMPPGTTSGA